MAFALGLKFFRASEGLHTTSSELNAFIRSLITNHDELTRIRSNAKESIYRSSFYLSEGISIIKGVGKFDIFASTGKTRMHSCFVAFIPETKTAVTILCNNVSGTDDLGMLILRMINKNFKRNNG